MKKIYALLFFVMLFSSLLSCNGQTKSSDATQTNATANKTRPVGGGCDGCEIMFVGMPATINAVDTSAGWTEPGQKLLVTGKVFKADGKTAATGVIIYYWQTDNNGYYSPGEGMDAKARRHGHIRGWVKSAADGSYSIYTVKPSPYPNENIPAHIHIAIKEPGIDDAYYIDELVFNDDKLLTDAKRKALENRGGTGILNTSVSGASLVATHNIIVGLNIPNYPTGK